MADQTVTELVIDSNTSGAADYERAMAGAAQAAQRGTDAANNFNVNLVALGTGAIAAGLAIKGALDQILDANKGLADMQALSVRVGLSLKDLQGVQFGGSIAGLSDGTINSGLEKSAQLLNDASRNANSLSKVFDENGLSIRNANGQLISQNQLLQIGADLVSRARNPQDAIAIAQMLGFTKEWVPLLQQGSSAMRALGDEAAKAGAVIDDETVNRATEFDQRWRRSSVEFSSYMKSALLGLLPIVDDLIEGAARFIKSIDRKTIEDHAKAALQPLSDAGVPDSAGLKFGVTPQLEKAMADWNNSNLSFGQRLENIVQGLWSAAQVLSAADVKFAAGTGQAFKDYSGAQDAFRWKGQGDSWKSQSAGFLAGADASGASSVPGRDVANDAVDRAINQLRKHTEQQIADSAAVGQGVGVMALFRAQAAETAAVLANGGKETEAQAAAFAKLKIAAADAAIALERAKINENIRFGASTSLLSQTDVSIAQQLKGIYPDVATALASVEAQALRTNAAFREIGTSIENNLVTGLTDIGMGTKSVSTGFADMGASIARSIEQMIIKLYVVLPLMRALQATAGSMGWLPTGGGSSGQDFAAGGFSGGAVNGLHSGGIVGGEATFNRYVHPAYFDNAPRFHAGGIAGDEVPIIARKGEGVFTPQQMAAMGGSGNVTVNVLNAPSDTTATVATRRSGNDLHIDVMLDALIARKMVQPGSASNRVLTDQLGGTQQVATR